MIPAKPQQTYVPRVFGFKVSEESLFYQNREDGANQGQIQGDRLARRSRHRSSRK
jgi:hypothetical protein